MGGSGVRASQLSLLPSAGNAQLDSGSHRQPQEGYARSECNAARQHKQGCPSRNRAFRQKVIREQSLDIAATSQSVTRRHCATTECRMLHQINSCRKHDEADWRLWYDCERIPSESSSIQNGRLSSYASWSVNDVLAGSVPWRIAAAQVRHWGGKAALPFWRA
jgi:hypothetical protein